VDEDAVTRNLEILRDVRDQSGASVLLALKAFAMYPLFPLMREFLDGICASGYNEARLGYEEFGKEVHTYCPAYSDDEFDEIASISDHIIFNSLKQFHHFRKRIPADVSIGLRVNPEVSQGEVELYDPCARYSRLGMRAEHLHNESLEGIEGLHVHALCEQDFAALMKMAEGFENRFGRFLSQMKWINFGGGHHITKPDYDVEALVDFLKQFKEKYLLQVIVEPGEAAVLGSGYLVATVLDIVHNEIDIAILDVSCTCHMPDVLEMPYRPEVFGAGEVGEYSYAYRLAGASCLAGDVIGDYSFPEQLKRGDRLVFQDMAHYTMVKTTMFNGVKHPSIASWCSKNDKLTVHRTFTFEDFKQRLG
jgi:carboxynorspermidine decarboxylase